MTGFQNFLAGIQDNCFASSFLGSFGENLSDIKNHSTEAKCCPSKTNGDRDKLLNMRAKGSFDQEVILITSAVFKIFSNSVDAVFQNNGIARELIS